eukprot:TRINITY_DN87209_c0_g1_i1.p1 TRINITY_DN87209_c0_g1~~TRINITY_DN87209_c0_g1_i1.p1  ORF type:complete len:625 (-),score=87.02 TRINITY_DN87209_c0_g1_i1:279-2153(-)
MTGADIMQEFTLHHWRTLHCDLLHTLKETINEHEIKLRDSDQVFRNAALIVGGSPGIDGVHITEPAADSNVAPFMGEPSRTDGVRTNGSTDGITEGIASKSTTTNGTFKDAHDHEERLNQLWRTSVYGSHPMGEQAPLSNVGSPTPANRLSLRRYAGLANRRGSRNSTVTSDERRTSGLSSIDWRQLMMKQGEARFGPTLYSLDSSHRLDVIDEELYDVAKYYARDGWAQSLAQSVLFERLTLVMIFANAIYIGLDADANGATALHEVPLIYQVFAHSFCGFFTLEIVVRCLAFVNKRDCFKDFWFVFESFLVLVGIFETWVFTAILASLPHTAQDLPGGLVVMQLLRLLRLLRLTRLLKPFPELLTLIHSVRSSLRAASSCCILIVGVNYGCALIIKIYAGPQLGADQWADPDRHWGTVLGVMRMLLFDGTLMVDPAGFVRALFSIENNLLASGLVLLLMTYIFLTNITIMNMLIGIICEVVSASKQEDEESRAIDFMRATLRGMLVALDQDGNGTVAKDELRMLMEIDSAVKVLKELRVNPTTLLMLVDDLFEGKGQGWELARKDLMEYIIHIRGSRHVTMQDFVEVRCDIRQKMSEMQSELECRMDAIMDMVLDKSNEAIL